MNNDIDKKTDDIDPLDYLQGLVNGYDLRKTNRLLTLIENINDRSGSNISKEDWSEVVDIVRSDYKHSPVRLSDSITAAKTLSEYLHSKKRQIDVSADLRANMNISELTEDELENFKKMFDENY